MNFLRSNFQGVLVGVVVGLATIFVLQPIAEKNRDRKELIQADKANFYIACNILEGLNHEGGVPAFSYETSVYAENFSFISSELSPELQERLHTNLQWMNLSNNMITTGLLNVPRVTSEVRNNLKKPTYEVIKNIVSNYQGISTSDCPYYNEEKDL